MTCGVGGTTPPEIWESRFRESTGSVVDRPINRLLSMVPEHSSDATGFAATYIQQARTYDHTRSAGRETLDPLLAALAEAPGRYVLDVGGGTGNYAMALASQGFDVLVLDRSDDMLEVASSKGLRVRQADATNLPEPDGCADAVTMVSMLHQVPDWTAAIREGKRVLRPGGLLCLLLYTQEHMESHFFLNYFPSSRTWAVQDMRPISDYLGALPGAKALPLQIRGIDDLTMHVMRRHPYLALDPDLHSQTSFFARLQKEAPEELETGLQRLADDIESGLLPSSYDRDLADGDAYFVTWRKPK